MTKMNNTKPVTSIGGNSKSAQPSQRAKKTKKAALKATTVAPKIVLPKLPLPPAIPERKPSEAEAERLARYNNSVLMKTLSWMLSNKRPHESAAERNALGYLLRLLPDNAKWTFDATGNLHVDMREHFKDGELVRSRTLFVAHVDTVHRDTGFNKIRMTDCVWYACGSQLGADDGAGVALLAHMMLNRVAAYYMFTIGEECGGVGAREVAKNERLLEKFDRAIAFDRRDTTSVISHQGYGRCASDAFCEAMSTALCDQGLLYMPDDGGVYTDTAEFTDVIPECTNISVGYMREHSTEEALDIGHLQHLADAVLAIDWEALPVARDPKDIEPISYGSYRSSTITTPSMFQSQFDDDMADDLEDALIQLKQGSAKEMRVLLATELCFNKSGADKDKILQEVDKALLTLDDSMIATYLIALRSGAYGWDVFYEILSLLELEG